jgi:general secretion pathway protein G
MPGTSVSCRRSHERLAARGFTLIELLVVLALMALVTGLVAPAVIRGIDAARERGVAKELEVVLAGLPVRAFQRGTDLEIDAASLRGLLADWPQDWQLEMDSPLRYGPTGVASGGVVRLRVPDRVPIGWRVAPVSGEVERRADIGAAR